MQVTVRDIVIFPCRTALPGIWLLLVALSGSLQAQPTDSATLVVRGNHAFQKGAFSEAAASWEQALALFRAQSDAQSEIRTSLSLASAYQAIGHHRRAVRVLEDSLLLAERSDHLPLVNLVKGKLGAALIMTMDLERAAALLQDAMDAARAAKNIEAEAEVLNDLGNLFLTQQHSEEALSTYQLSVELARQSGNAALTAQALCNAAALASQSNDPALAGELNAQALLEIDRLEDSHAKAFLLLTSGQTDRQIISSVNEASEPLLLRARNSFQLALALGGQLDDQAIETYALGYLAALYEQDGQPAAALALARRAAFVAQQARMPEALYRWEWHAGRLLKAQGDIQSSVAAYRRAVQGMDPIRNDFSLGYGNAGARRSFRESQGPLFLELADLLLQLARSASDPATEQQLLLEARDTMEYLKTVELEDYFCDDCVDVQRANTRAIETVDQNTAVIYVIPLAARTEVLVGLTAGLTRVSLGIGADTLTAEVNQFRRNLETRTTYAYLEQAQRLYDWLIRPIHGLLTENRIHTLVFVPDGALRTIPFASLHDGERFLIEEMAVAVVPGLSLVEPQTLERGNARLLLNGLSKSVQGFPPLNFVAQELSKLQPLFPSETLFNDGFTLDALTRKFSEEQYSIIHIASHGQFDRDVRKTFVLTYDGKLTLNDLEALIRPSRYRGRPLELLVLSACQTAAGDDRAALGLAGVAVKAGARSALATLWFVNDQSTSALISEFYGHLQLSPSISKARALQLAQIALLRDRRYRHPCYWSPYLIIGNWL